jgi:adenylate cyclase
MGIEIERKFLVRHEGWRGGVTKSVRIRQGYLDTEKQCSVRVRISGDCAWLNIKSATIGASRQEFEYEIPLADAVVMLESLCRKPLVEKVRHFVTVAGVVWEIDVFEGENEGLVVAEIELEHPDKDFGKPDWLGLEVTHDERYYNNFLSSRPFRRWPEAERCVAEGGKVETVA